MKNHNGFTMVELLAVITILAIIMVILIPAVTNISKNTNFEDGETLYFIFSYFTN